MTDSADLPGSMKSANAKDSNPELIVAIEKSYAEGYRLYTIHDYEGAAEELAKTNEMSVELYGQFAPECFKPHYYYGLCMLEIAQNRIQEQLLTTVGESGRAMEEENECDDNEAESAQDESADASELTTKNGGSTNSDGNAQKVEADSPSKGTTTVAKVEARDDQVESTTMDANSEDIGDDTLKSDGEGDAGAEDDDEDDLSAERLAWESLEVARKICEKMETDNATEWSERRADTLCALSECMILSEQYDTALTDLKSVLDIQKRLFSLDDRRIAETHYNMGRCYRNADDFESATQCFLEAGRQLQKLIDAIEEKGEVTTEEDDKALAQLKQLVAEIDENVRDAYDSLEMRTKQLSEQRDIVTNAFKEALGNNVQTDDITQLLTRRPRNVDMAGDKNGGASSVPTNTAGAASTTATTTDAVEGATTDTKSTDVHTGTEIEIESVSASGDGIAGALKRPASEVLMVDSKKAKVAEEQVVAIEQL